MIVNVNVRFVFISEVWLGSPLKQILEDWAQFKCACIQRDKNVGTQWLLPSSFKGPYVFGLDKVQMGLLLGDPYFCRVGVVSGSSSLARLDNIMLFIWTPLRHQDVYLLSN